MKPMTENEADVELVERISWAIAKVFAAGVLLGFVLAFIGLAVLVLLWMR